MARLDAKVEYHGNIYLVNPKTKRARKWINENVGADAMFWAGSLVVDQHYIDNLVFGMQSDGLNVS